MAAFVELVTDPFEGARNAAYDSAFVQKSTHPVRRPTRGLEIKDETPAILRVIRGDGTEVGLVDAGAPNGQGYTEAGYSNFLLQNVVEPRAEKHQIIETFGASYIYFFGEAPRYLDVQVILINSLDFNWEAEWWQNYENNLRGTRLVEQGARLYMFYDDNIVEGYMLGCQAQKVADQPLSVALSFRLFVTGYKNISLQISEPGKYPLHIGSPGKNRSEISDNKNEYLYGGEPRVTDSTKVSEVDDLATSAINESQNIGADLDNPDKLKDLGMIPKSEKELEKEAKSFGQEVTSFEDAQKDSEAIYKDPLSSVVGGGGTIGYPASIGNTSEGDAYGISTGSKYGDGPGYGGQVGHGEFGGTQAGSGMGDERDPGFKQPDYSDPTEPITPQKMPEENSIFSEAPVSLGASHQGNSGGASITEQQGPVFAMTSTEGGVSCAAKRDMLQKKYAQALADYYEIKDLYNNSGDTKLLAKLQTAEKRMYLYGSQLDDLPC
jgi:hypothetical protein